MDPHHPTLLLPGPANANRSRSLPLVAALAPAAFLLDIRTGSAMFAASIANKASQLPRHSLPPQADVPALPAPYDRLDVHPAPKVYQDCSVFCVPRPN